MPDPSATTVRDDFNRAAEGPPPSASWTNGISTFVAGEGLVVVADSTCRRLATGGFRQGSYWNVSTFGPDAEVIVSLPEWSDAPSNELALYARLANIGSGTTDGYTLNIARTATQTEWSIYRVDNAAFTLLGAAVVQAVALADTLCLQIIGSTLKGWRKPSAGAWTEILSRTDATYTAAGFVAAEITNNQQTAIDNFIVDTITGVGTVNTIFRGGRGSAW